MVLQAAVDDRQVIEMSEALERLAKKDERSAKAIELRYFGGFEVQEISETLGACRPHQAKRRVDAFTVEEPVERRQPTWRPERKLLWQRLRRDTHY